MEQHHKSLKQELLAQALKNIAEQGLEDFSLRELAKQLHVSHASPYRHFTSKEILIRDLLIQGYDILTTLLEHALKTATDPKQKLYALGFAYVTFFLDNRAYFSLMYEHNVMNEEIMAEIMPHRERAYGLLKAFIGEHIADGTFFREDPDRVVFASWAYLHGLVMLWHRQNPSGDKNFREELQAYIELFVNRMLLSK